MADNIQQPSPPDYSYGQFKRVPGTGGTSFPDTFVGPKDKAYADFITRDLTRLRGTNAYYYVKADHPKRIDGATPISDSDAVANDVLARKRHAGMALYGEHVIVGDPLDTVRDEIQPDWPYSDPILVRGVINEVPEHENDPDERGAIFVNGIVFNLARVLCEKEWRIAPKTGDIVRFTSLLKGYYDIEDVDRMESGLGSSGFFTVYKCTLRRSTKFEPQRKIAATKTTDDADIEAQQTSGPPTKFESKP